jgi:hypothetical protein
MSRQAGILLPGYNPLLVANAPTIGTASVASATSVSVAFTAPSCTGGSVISTYSAYCTTTGTNRATGASSPITVTGLTTGTAYTFRVIATNIYGPSYPSGASNSATPAVIGAQVYNIPGTYSWVAPSGVSAVSVVAVGGGGSVASGQGGTGAGGAGLGYKNNYTVAAGSSYTVIVGRSFCYCGPSARCGGTSSFVSAGVVSGGGGSQFGTGGSYTGDGGGNGGAGGAGSVCGTTRAGGGGGAGGYSGTGGTGGRGAPTLVPATAGAGGGGGGGGPSCFNSRGGGGGGGVDLLGQGGNGAAGATNVVNGWGTGGGGGSGGSCGNAPGNTSIGGNGGFDYGGGGGGGGSAAGGSGGRAGVRIIWPGNTRTFPSTNTGNL